MGTYVPTYTCAGYKSLPAPRHRIVYPRLFLIYYIPGPMKYTYSIVEAAALWAGVDFAIIRERMDSADIAAIEAGYEEDKRTAFVAEFEAEDTWRQQRKACSQCELEAQCPDGLLAPYSLDAPELLGLQCPQGFHSKPGEDAPTSRTVTKRKFETRLLPHPGEFDDLPDFERRLGWLQTALNLGDLDGTPEIVRASDLRGWLHKHFPDHTSSFVETDGAEIKKSVSEKKSVTINNISGKPSKLETELREAIRLAGGRVQGNTDAIWKCLSKLADEKFGCLEGVSQDGIAYKGDKYYSSLARNPKNPVFNYLDRGDLSDSLRTFRKRERS